MVCEGERPVCGFTTRPSHLASVEITCVSKLTPRPSPVSHLSNLHRGWGANLEHRDLEKCLAATPLFIMALFGETESPNPRSAMRPCWPCASTSISLFRHPVTASAAGHAIGAPPEAPHAIEAELTRCRSLEFTALADAERAASAAAAAACRLLVEARAELAEEREGTAMPDGGGGGGGNG